MIGAFLALEGLHKCFASLQGVLENRLGTPVCIPDCGVCCKGNVPNCMIIEAIFMVSSLPALGTFKQAVDAAEAWLLEKPVIAAHEVALSYDGLPVGPVSRKIRDQWAQVAKWRCPFLMDDMRCLIHSCRPLVCRAFGVTREGEGCPRPLGRGETLMSRGVMDSSKVAPFVREFKDYCQKKPEWTIRSFAPTLLFRAAEPEKFRSYVDDNRIPSCKIIGSAIDVSLMWQPQLDALRQGVAPDVVAYAYNTATPEQLLRR